MRVYLTLISVGSISLKQVNIKPNKAEKLLMNMNMPVALKAGTIGKLELKVGLMSMFSSDVPQIDVTLHDAYFILSPTMRMNSKDDSYLQETEEELLEPYDHNNCFNIFSNNLKLKKKTGLE